MKKLTITFGIMLIFTIGALAQQFGNSEITLTKTTHDFGNLAKNGNATTEFTFTNTGNSPLIISNCKQSCGCTVPTWPREPIAPGESGTIKVKYDSTRVGPFNKSVTITSNATNNPSQVIRITGTIEDFPKGTSPN